MGYPLDVEDIEKAITSSPEIPDTVIIALASVRQSDSPFSKPVSPPRLMTDTHKAVLEAMKKFRIQRLITISAFGVGDSNASVWWPMRMVLNHSLMAFAFEDHNAVEMLVRDAAKKAAEKKKGWELNWTLVRPAMLNDKEEAGTIRVVGDNGDGAGMLPGIARSSVAAFVVENCLERGEFAGKTPVICN